MNSVDVDRGVAASQFAASKRTLFGHPPGLAVLFLTEMWEKFSFFGMRTLLVYYMVTTLEFHQAHASLIYGSYTAIAYLTPIFGGPIADRWLGRHRAVIVGGSTMALGHFMLTQEVLFFPALAAIALGNGFFLPSLPGQVRGLYQDGDPRRTGAYSIYYMGINVGSFLAPLICGTLGELFGWHWGFGAAGVGMILGLCVYMYGSKWLPASARVAATRVRSQVETTERASTATNHRPLILALASVALVVVIFRMAYEQQSNTLALWAMEVDRHIGSWTIPMTWFQSLNPLIVFAVTPLLVALWTQRAEAGKDVPPVRRMAIGAALGGISYLWLALAQATALHQIPGLGWLTIVVYFLLLTIGELYILPVGLSLFGRLAPRGLESTMIALWFLASFGGNFLSGALGSLWSDVSHGEFFVLTAAVSFISAALLVYLNSRLRHRLAT
jgi:POT family proton-dependent oligopeptide transporter